MNHNRQRIIFAIIASTYFLFFLCTAAQADLIVSDSFNQYALGSINGQVGGNDLGAPTGSWIGGYTANTNLSVISPLAGLNYSSGSVIVQGGAKALQLTNVGNLPSALSRAFTSQSGTVYFSYLFRAAVTPDPGLVSGDLVGVNLNNDASRASSGGIGMGNLSSSNPIYAQVVDAADTFTRQQAGPSVVSGQTMFLVGKISRSSNVLGDPSGVHHDRVDIWVNPTSNDELSNIALATAFRNSGNNAVISHLTMSTVGIDAADFYLIDELRIGSTFADVVPVPEPSLISMCVIAGTSGLIWHSRKRRQRMTSMVN
jgi:hypothetical protein